MRQAIPTKHCRRRISSKGDTSFLRASIHIEDCTAPADLSKPGLPTAVLWPLHVRVFPLWLARPFLMWSLSAWKDQHLSVCPAHVVSWHGVSGGYLQACEGGGHRHHTPGVGFSRVSRGSAVLPLRCSLIVPFPPPMHSTTEGGPGSVSFTDAEQELCEWAGSSCPLCLLFDTWEVSKAPFHQGADDKKTMLD